MIRKPSVSMRFAVAEVCQSFDEKKAQQAACFSSKASRDTTSLGLRSELMVATRAADDDAGSERRWPTDDEQMGITDITWLSAATVAIAAPLGSKIGYELTFVAASTADPF